MLVMKMKYFSFHSLLFNVLLIVLAAVVIKYIIEQQTKKNSLLLAQSIILSHQHELTLKRCQLTIYNRYNHIDDKQWQQEKVFFMDNLVIPNLIVADASILQQLNDYIEIITADYETIQADFDPNMSPYDYEHYVASVLRNLGWNSMVTKSSGDQGVDVIASKNNIKVVIQCKLYSKPVGNKAVQEILAGQAFERAHYAVVVSNNSFTRAALQLSSSTGVKLLHHSQLSELENFVV
jgi:restriction system protein